LNLVLFALMLWTLFRLTLMVPLGPSAELAMTALLLVIYGAASFVLHRGSLAAASWIYLAATWLVRTVGILLSGDEQLFGALAYLALAIPTAWLLGPRVALAGTGMSIAILFAGAKLPALQPVLPLTVGSSPADHAVAFFEAGVIGLIPVLRLVQLVRDAVFRSSAAEEKLQLYQAGLEKLVRQRTAELEVARDEAQAATRAKSIFLATVSHELRSPLNTILLLSDPEWLDPAIPESGRHDLLLIRRSGENLLHLIDDILESAGVDPGHLTPHNATFDFVDLLHEVRDLMLLRAAERSLDFCLELSPGIPRFVSADAAKLRHVLVNLMDDAIRYTERGLVRLSAEAHTVDPSGRLRLTFAIGDGTCGNRAESGSACGGIGLGLSMTRLYLLVLGGSFRLERTSGGVPRFIVDIPATLAAAPADVRGLSPASRVLGLTPGQPECRVMIVEDQLEERLVLRRMLQDAGFQVESAENGECALALFPAWKPHFMWIDRRLQRMDGPELTRSVQGLEGGDDVKIAGLGASFFPAEREEMLAAGAHDFIRKPFHPDEIFDCMARHLGLRYEYAAVCRQSA
jgi:signal transduction histidine kinase/CheY-like chemotaxis protein